VAFPFEDILGVGDEGEHDLDVIVAHFVQSAERGQLVLEEVGFVETPSDTTVA